MAFGISVGMQSARRVALIVCGMSLVGAARLAGAAVVLQNATSTLSQSGYPVAQAIDGDTNSAGGWGIYDSNTGQIAARTAVFELQTPQITAGGTWVTIVLDQAFPQHSIGRFRLSVTGDDQSTFADGLGTGGDVSANWTVLSASSLSATNGVVLTSQQDFSVLASGPLPATTRYTFSAFASISMITGVRLEVMEDPSLPYGRPGRDPANGNLVLTEISMDIAAIPEPAQAALFVALGGLGLAGIKRRRLQAQRRIPLNLPHS